MNKNIVFYFSGTGNCLKVAKEIAKSLPNCKIVSMGKKHCYNLENEYDSIGFVYPTYFSGIPLKVNEFVMGLNFNNNKSTYVYAIATCGGAAGNALAQLGYILQNKGMNLSYGKKLNMFSNYVVIYNMSENVDKITAKSDKALIPIINDIKNKRINKIGKPNPLLNLYYKMIASKIYNMDKNYNISDNCISCGICKEVCPVENIKLVNGKPIFGHHCEQCVACIQYCPKKAINYKNATQKRRRYTNPSIKYKELSEHNK